RFAQMILEMTPGGGTTATRDDGLEHVFYLLSGTVSLSIDDEAHELRPGGYVYVPTGHSYDIRAGGDDESRLIWIKRPYEKVDLPVPDPIIGHRDSVEKYQREEEPGRYWQRLLPTEDLAFDMHVNI